jgi:hypothetical protein
MAAFSTNVIEMPDLASRAFQMYQIGLSQQEKAEEKAKLEQERQSLKRERISDVEGTRGMLDKAYSLEPAAREAASLLFKEYEKASVNYNTTGSEQDKARMFELKGKFSQVIGQGLAIADQKKQEAEEFRRKPQMFTPDSERNLSERIKPIQSFKPRVDENGIIVGTYNGQEMPIMDIPYFGSEIIPGLNALGLDRIDNTIKVLNPENMAKSALQNFIDANGVRQDFGSSVTYNKDNLIKLSNDWLTQELAIPKAMEMVFIFDAANKTGFDPEKLSTSEYLRILDEYKNPELAKQAVERYKTNVLNRVESMIPAAQVGATGGGGRSAISEKTSDYLDLIGIDNPLIEGGGQGGAKGIRRVVFNHELPVSVSVPGLLDEEVKETQYIKNFGFDKNGKMYFTVEDEAGDVISPNDPKFNYNRYLSSMTKELNRNRVYNLIRDYSKNLLEKGSGFNADQAIEYLRK